MLLIVFNKLLYHHLSKDAISVPKAEPWHAHNILIIWPFVRYVNSVE